MQYDNAHCGDCDTTCKSDESCVAGTCVKNTCGDEMTFCGMGDCRDTKTRVDNCGACNNSCSSSAPANATAASCTDGVCQYVCLPTQQNCGDDTTANSIMCVSTSSMQYDNYHCGNCDTVCRSDESCVEGKCVINTCAGGMTLCGLNNCRDTKESLTDCGACNNSCFASAPANATATSCSNGVCQYGCLSTHQNCGGTTAHTIMCVSTASMQYDNYHCGNCGTVCGSDESCVAGECKKNTCDDGKTFCGMGDCRSIYGNDPLNCGGCNYVCADHSTIKAKSNTCANGVCQYVCQLSGDTNCGGTTLDTVNCVNLLTDNDHCGLCTNSCDTSAGKYCSNGVCKQSCPSGMTNCNSECRDLNYDSYNCGTCNHGCGKDERCSLGKCLKEFGGGLFYGNSSIPNLMQTGHEFCSSLDDDMQHYGNYSMRWYDFETGSIVEASKSNHDIYYNIDNGLLQSTNSTKFYSLGSYNISNAINRLYTSPYCPNADTHTYSVDRITTGNCDGQSTIYCIRTSDGNYYKMFALTNEMPTLLIWHLAIPTEDVVY